MVGTLEPYRGRGTASALMTRSLIAFAAEGLTHAALNVDVDGPTSAARLYREFVVRADHPQGHLPDRGSVNADMFRCKYRGSAAADQHSRPAARR